MARSRLSRIVRRTLAVLLGIVLAFGLIEAAVRCLPGVPPGVRAAVSIHEGRRLVVGHPQLRHVLAPGLVDARMIDSDFRVFHVSTTSEPGGFGWRGAHEPAPMGVVLGDSFAFGFGVDDDQTIPSLLSERFGAPFANYGVFGYGPQQAALVAREHALVRAPRVAVWIICGNDLGDAKIFSEWTAAGRAAQATGPAREFHNTWWATYKYYRYLSTFLGSGAEHWSSEGVEQLFGASILDELDLSRARIRRGLEFLEGELASFQEACASRGVTPVLVLAPFKEAVYAQEFQAIAGQDLAAGRAQETHARIARAAGELGVAILDLTEAFRQERGRQLYQVVDVHLSPLGNEVAARAIGVFLEDVVGLER